MEAGSGLDNHIVRISHVVVNVSDLEKARAFYESSTPLRVVARLKAPRQRFAGLGIDQGDFEGYVLDDGSAGQPAAVHLVEWKTPAPVGKANRVYWHVGMNKFGIGTNMPPNDRLERLRQLGISPTNERIVRGYITIADPDGIGVSFFQEGDPSARYDHLVHTALVVTDARRSIHFLRDVLGLELYRDVETDGAIPVSQGPGMDVSQWESHLLAARGDRRFNADVTQKFIPALTPGMADPYEKANNVGISRLGFEVDDIDEAYELLRTSETIGRAPGIVCPPETWDLGPDVGIRRVLAFRDPDGIRLEFVEKPPRPASSFIRFSA